MCDAALPNRSGWPAHWLIGGRAARSTSSGCPQPCQAIDRIWHQPHAGGVLGCRLCRCQQSKIAAAARPQRKQERMSLATFLTLFRLGGGGEEYDDRPVGLHDRTDRVGGMGGYVGCAAGTDAVEPAGVQGLAEAIADELFGLGDAHVDRPVLDHNVGEPGGMRRGAHRGGAGEDGDSDCLQFQVPVGDLPACLLRDGVDPVTCLASADITEHRGSTTPPAARVKRISSARPAEGSHGGSARKRRRHRRRSPRRRAARGCRRARTAVWRGPRRGVGGGGGGRGDERKTPHPPAGPCSCQCGADRSGASAGVEHNASGQRVATHCDEPGGDRAVDSRAPSATAGPHRHCGRLSPGYAGIGMPCRPSASATLASHQHSSSSSPSAFSHPKVAMMAIRSTLCCLTRSTPPNPVRSPWVLFNGLVADSDRNTQVCDDVQTHSPAAATAWCSPVRPSTLTPSPSSAERGHHPCTLYATRKAKELEELLAQLANLSGDGPPLLVIATDRYVGDKATTAPSWTHFSSRTPFKGSMVQYVGRVLRTHPGKTSIEVHDYVDSHLGVL